MGGESYSKSPAEFQNIALQRGALREDYCEKVVVHGARVRKASSMA
jgi:hypothetical protein